MRSNLQSFTYCPISDLIWLSDGTLFVGTSHQVCQFGGVTEANQESSRHDRLLEHVAQMNGPLCEYHPQMILQCLLWGS